MFYKIDAERDMLKDDNTNLRFDGETRFVSCPDEDAEIFAVLSSDTGDIGTYELRGDFLTRKDAEQCLETLKRAHQVTDIVWDTDGEDIADLPTDYVIPQGELISEDDAVDWLSDKFGWCITSCNIARVVDDKLGDAYASQ